MYKIAITGKANSGKNTVGKLLLKNLYESDAKSPIFYDGCGHQYIAFADPIKEMARIAFPDLPRKWFYGPSKFRTMVIPGAFKDGAPLTVRQVLLDLGNDFGRRYQSTRWLNTFDHTFNKCIKRNRSIVIVTDVRFRNEFDHLKNKDFFQIRLLRNDHAKIDDISETSQDGIKDSEYDAIINNNGSLDDLKQEVRKIIPILSVK